MGQISHDAAANSGVQPIAHISPADQKALWAEVRRQALRLINRFCAKGDDPGGFDADDLAQDCYIRLHDTLGKRGDTWVLRSRSQTRPLQDVQNLQGFLAWMAERCLRDAMRRQRAEDARNSSYDLCDPRPLATDAAERIDARRKGLQLMRQGDAERQALMLVGATANASAAERKRLQRLREKISDLER